MNLLKLSSSILVAATIAYTIVGTGTRVDEIKSLSPEDIESRNWEVVRYEGYDFGSWSNHGGKVWYHVKDLTVKNTYYRVYLTMWGGEIHYHYGSPEVLNRVDVSVSQ